MTDEHVWVTLADGLRLYVGKVPTPKTLAEPIEPPLKAKRKRRQNPPPAPVETLHAD